jgi:hypothetical protein
MVPVALRLVPSLEQSLWPAIPALVRGSMILTWEARRGHDATARLAALPLVLRGSVAVLAEAVRNAQPLPDEEQVLRWLRAEMRRVLASVQRTRPARARPQPPRPAEAPLERRASPLAHRNGTRHVEAAQWP